MTQRVLSPELKKQYDLMRDLLKRCLSLTDKCSDEEASKIILDRLSHMQSAALFVFVGEVKSGKSSFINALLGEEICEVAPDPCTAGIQELVYGEERTRKSLGDNWERVTLPATVLQDISIVDTPGTNSIIRNHQTITENYIPQSDLIIFVFPAKNPHTGSAWDLLSLIRKEWRRKTVFVLQQADLATQQELSVNQERVRQYARERNVQNPVVFTVSAKREIEGAQDSGFTEFREFLREAVQSGEVWRMKVEGSRDTIRSIVANLLSGIRKEQAVIQEDKTFYEKLVSRIEGKREKAGSLRRLAVDSLCVTYDRLASRLEQDFAEGLSVSALLRRSIPFLRDKDVKTWLKDMQGQFEKTSKQEIDIESLRVSKDISDEIKLMFEELKDAVAHRQNVSKETGMPSASDRAEVLSRLQQQLQGLRISDIVGDKGIQASDLGNRTLAGGGIAAVGALIAFLTKIVVIDITGGVIALAGAGLVAVTLLWKRSGIMRDFSRNLEKSREEFRGRLDREIAQMFDKLFMEINHRLREPLSSLEESSARLARLAEEADQINKATEDL